MVGSIMTARTTEARRMPDPRSPPPKRCLSRGIFCKKGSTSRWKMGIRTSSPQRPTMMLGTAASRSMQVDRGPPIRRGRNSERAAAVAIPTGMAMSRPTAVVMQGVDDEHPGPELLGVGVPGAAEDETESRVPERRGGLPHQAHHQRDHDGGEDQDPAPPDGGVDPPVRPAPLPAGQPARPGRGSPPRAASRCFPLAPRPAYRPSSARHPTVPGRPSDQLVKIGDPVAVCRPSSVEWARLTAVAGNGA